MKLIRRRRYDIRKAGAIAALCLLLLCGACSKRPKTVMSDRKTAAVMADMQIASAYINANYSEFESDSARVAFREAVLASRGVTQEQLDTTLAWYARHPEEYGKMTQRVITRIEKIQSRSFPADVLAEKSSGKNLWPYSPSILLSNLSPTDGLIFNLTPDELSQGDNLTLYANAAQSSQLLTLFGVEYDDGSRHYLSRNQTAGTPVDLSLQTDSTKHVKRIFGKITVANRDRLPLLLDSISVTHQPMNRENYFRISSQRFQDKPGAKKAARREAEEKAKADSIQAAASSATALATAVSAASPAAAAPKVSPAKAGVPPSAGAVDLSKKRERKMTPHRMER